MEEKKQVPRRATIWWIAARPKTLTASVVPVLAATALVAALHYEIIGWVFVCCLATAIFIQIGTNFLNDALDFKKGADGETRLGPPRVTQQGYVPAEKILRAGFFCLFIATLFGLPLILKGGWVIALFGTLSLLFAYMYTGGPFPLAYRGLGDLFVVLFFGLVAVGAVFYLMTGTMVPHVWVAGLQVGFLATVLIAVNNLRDIHTDQEVGKKTLAVRLGVRGAKVEIYLLVFLPFVLSFWWLQHHFFMAAALPWICWPLAMILLKNIMKTPPSSVYNQFLGQAALLHLFFGLFLTVGLFLV